MMAGFRTVIEAAELGEHLGDSDWVVFDCRFNLLQPEAGHEAYLRAHIPGARYAHLDHDLSDPISPGSGRHPLPEIARFNRWLGANGVTPASQVVCYDDAGGSVAARLWWLLQWIGHQQVALLNGGWSCWLKNGGKEATDLGGAAAQPPYPGNPDPGAVLPTSALEADLAAVADILIDVRTTERFRGEAEPIDPIAGHVPGAHSLPWTTLVDAEGRLLPDNHLAERLTSAGAARPEAAFMCGSGVTACLGLLARVQLGWPMGRLYAGSWSEWIRDDNRPVASGD
jgi:thiosulfate/3-mercaptopyruvate sulfurtransferase